MNEHHVVLSMVTVAGLDLIHPSQELSLSQRSLEPEVGDTIVYFARAERIRASESADAPVG